MKAKTIISVVLLLFVMTSLAWLVLKEKSGKSTGAGQVPPASAEGKEAASQAKADAEKTKLIAYYFHGNMRCTKCRTIEAYTKDAISKSFADAIKNGRLEWRVVNIEEPENEHFVKDFQLTTRSVVLDLRSNGKSIKWKNLEEIWDLVGDEAAFKEYIKTETKNMLEQEGK